MARLLYIQASPRLESYSTKIGNAFVSAYRQAHPQDGVETLDLYKDPIPPFLAPQAAAKYAVLSGKEPQGQAEEAWRDVIGTIEHFKGFDRYVLSSPMWNFNIPYRLKQYIDVIVQPGLTFRYSPEKGYEGLVAGKSMMMLLARGGVYGTENPVQTMEFQESYLRTIFGFIGIQDIRSISLQGTLMHAPDVVESDLRSCIQAAAKAAIEFAPVQTKQAA